MKKEQQRRITEDKKDGVHEQLLHTVSCCFFVVEMLKVCFDTICVVSHGQMVLLHTSH